MSTHRGPYQKKVAPAKPKRDAMEIRGYIDGDDYAFLAVLAKSKKKADGGEYSVFSVVRGVIQRFVRDKKRDLSLLHAEMKSNGIDLEATTGATEGTTDAMEEWETVPRREL